MRPRRQVICNGEAMSTVTAQYRASKLEALTAQLDELKAELSARKEHKQRKEIKNLFARANEDLLVARISILEVRAKLLELGEV